MYGLRLEDGRDWGEAAESFQIEDVEHILGHRHPTWNFLTRPRGGSKSTDVAGMGVSWLAIDAPSYSNGHVVASSTDQAAIIVDAAAGFVARDPELGDLITVESQRIVANKTRAWIRVLAQSDSSAWGLRDAHFLTADEFCQWPNTRGARRVWRAIQSAAPKVPGCRVVVMQLAGEPSHWSREVYDLCCQDPMWRVHAVAGPVPWLSEAELESLKFQMRPSEYDRLVLNIWAEDEDSAVSEEDWEIAAAQDYAELPPKPGVRYVVLVDIGLVDDATVMTIMHKEPMDPDHPLGIQRAVVDKIERWRGTKKRPVQLHKVEEWLVEWSRAYNKATIHADPTQFMGSMQRLNANGCRAVEFKFTASSVGEVAGALTSVFRNHQIRIPKSFGLKQELLALKLKESAPGVVRLDHLRNEHDDQAVTIGMGCWILIGQGHGLGAQWIDHMREVALKRKEHPEGDPLPWGPETYIAKSFSRDVDRSALCQHRWILDGTGLCAMGCGTMRCPVCSEVHKRGVACGSDGSSEVAEAFPLYRG